MIYSNINILKFPFLTSDIFATAVVITHTNPKETLSCSSRKRFPLLPKSPLKEVVADETHAPHWFVQPAGQLCREWYPRSPAHNVHTMQHRPN